MRDFGKKAAVVLLALALSVMMVPATAFADIGGNSYQVEVDASHADASHTSGEDVAADGKPAVGVLADNGHTAEVAVGNVTSTSNGKQAVMVGTDGGGTANVTTGNVTENYGPVGVSAKAEDGGKTNVTTGDITVARNYYAAKNTALDASASGEGSVTKVTAGNVTGAPPGWKWHRRQHQGRQRRGDREGREGVRGRPQRRQRPGGSGRRLHRAEARDRR